MINLNRISHKYIDICITWIISELLAILLYMHIRQWNRNVLKEHQKKKKMHDFSL